MDRKPYTLMKYFYLLILCVLPVFAETPPETYRQLNIFIKAMQKIQDESLYPISDKVLIEGAIKGMLATVDKYSGYLNTTDVQTFSQYSSGTFNGIGIEVSLDEKNKAIVSGVFPKSPAEKQGVEKGDFIEKIDDVSLENHTIDDINFLLNDPSRMQVNLTLTNIKDGKHQTEMYKQKINIPPSFEKMLTGNILYLRVANFNQVGLAQKLISKLRMYKNIRGLILDMRHNKGGIFEEAIAFANAFLCTKKITTLKTKNGAKDQHYISGPQDKLKHLGPIIILVDAYTASASEVFSGALQAHGRAILVGSNTYGKAAVQTLFPLEKTHAALRITTGQYLLPDGATLNEKGLVPNHIIPTTETFYDPIENNVYLEQDPAVIKGLELINDQKA